MHPVRLTKVAASIPMVDSFNSGQCLASKGIASRCQLDIKREVWRPRGLATLYPPTI